MFRKTVGCMAVLALGCSSFEDPGDEVMPDSARDPFSSVNGEVKTSSAAPLFGGTLDVTPDGTTAVAADPDRGMVYLVDLPSRAVTKVPVGEELELGRVLADDGRAFVAARRGGQVLVVDLQAQDVADTFSVCDSPRGLALSEDGATLHVACRGGDLLSLDAATGEEQRRLRLDSDLRDVHVRGAGLVVTRFRSAEVLVLDSAGRVTARGVPFAQDFTAPSVAWSSELRSDGRLVMLHQDSVTTPVSTAGQGYGAGCESSISTPVASVIDLGPEDEGEAEGSGEDAAAPPAVVGFAPQTTNQTVFRGRAGAMDMALLGDNQLVTVTPGNAMGPQPAETVAITDIEAEAEDVSGCSFGSEPDEAPPVAVAVTPSGQVVTQSRQPATLRVMGEAIVLSDESHSSTGNRLFHMNTGNGIACASCHPEGSDDGHTWVFGEIGMRRSQSLEGGISAIAPFHWDGELPTFRSLVDEVMVGRMGLFEVPDDKHVDALLGWLDEVPAASVSSLGDPESIKRGRDLFTSDEVGCSSCHGGTLYTDNVAHDVGTGGTFFTPPLVGISARPPFMHDGCATTLAARFGACGGGDEHGVTSHLTEEQVDDLVAFLESI